MLKLYYANIGLLEDEQVFQHVLEKVSIQRREKVLRCMHKKDKKRSLLAGYLLRIALEREGIVYEDLSFSQSDNGKPVILELPQIMISLTHAGSYAACVISSHAVGVDIETKEKTLFDKEKECQLISVAKKVLTQEEWQMFECADKTAQTELFLHFWTRKESYSKADGRGLGLKLNEIDTNQDAFYSKWLDETALLSMYTEIGTFANLQIEELVNL